MLAQTPICGVRLAHITTDEAEALRFDHSPSNANCALRTLRRMLGKAADWGVIAAAPRIKLAKEYGRSAIIDSEAEFKLLAVATQPLHDVLTLILDSGMRPGEVFQMRWEDIAWDRGMIFIPRGKTRRSRRHVPMSERVAKILHQRRNGQTEGWVFASDSRCGHITTVAKSFEQAREVAGLPKEIVLYSARHTFATKVMGGNGRSIPRNARLGSFKRADGYDLPASEPGNRAVGGKRKSRRNAATSQSTSHDGNVTP